MGSSQNKNNANPLGIMDTMLLCSSYLMSDSFAIPQTVPCRPLCLWDFPGRNTGVGCHFFLPGIFLTQGSNQVSYISRQIPYWGATREAQTKHMAKSTRICVELLIDCLTHSNYYSIPIPALSYIYPFPLQMKKLKVLSYWSSEIFPRSQMQRGMQNLVFWAQVLS